MRCERRMYQLTSSSERSLGAALGCFSGFALPADQTSSKRQSEHSQRERRPERKQRGSVQCSRH